jgi:hypothetical protein
MKRSTFDILSALPTHLSVKVLQQLDPWEILSARLVRYDRQCRLMLGVEIFQQTQPPARDLEVVLLIASGV